ncbi:MAG: hypothetical protein K2W96_08810, partial [Gemmataceae bacterium]|nr:hypothetical protein [Gemmataceae bacterium]
MPLEPDEKGLLPPGVHEATLEEIGAVFGRLQRTDRRMTLVARLGQYVEALRKAGLSGWLVVDGSFVMTSVDTPEDIDGILVLPEAWDMEADLRPYQYNLVSKKAIRRDFRFDI